MNLIPPLQDFRVYDAVEVDEKMDAITRASESITNLFRTAIYSANSFGSNEVWAYFTKKHEVADQLFFPDVAIFSEKLRFIDLLKKPFFACYSNYLFEAATSRLKKGFVFLSPVLSKIRHPYVLVENNWNKARLLNQLTQFNNAALVFLPKSTDAIDRKFSDEDLSSVIAKCMEFSDSVTLCVYFRDLHKYLDKPFPSSISVVSCGSRNDALFYFRLNALINSHKFVAYMEPGTHSVYAAVSGKKQLLIRKNIEISISNPYQGRRYPNASQLSAFTTAIQPLTLGTRPETADSLRDFLDYGVLRNDISIDNPIINYKIFSFVSFKFYRAFFKLIDGIERFRFT